MTRLRSFAWDDSGVTLVEYIAAAAILLIVAMGVIGALAYASTANAATAMRQRGLEIANQRMEQARNLPYDQLGTTNGYPTGQIQTPVTVTSKMGSTNATFTVVTDVQWMVDSTTNLSTNDKSVHITVSWTTPVPGTVSIESNIVRWGQTTSVNAGDVKINVVDADTGAKLSGISVSIKPASGTTSTASTNSDGYVRWGKIPSGSIKIQASSSDYFVDLTPVASASVLANQLNEWTLQASRASVGIVHVTDASNGGADLPGVTVTITGPAGNAGWSLPTGSGYTTTDSNGNATFPKLRKGTYTVTGALSGCVVQASPPSLAVIAGGNPDPYTSQLSMTRLTTILVTVTDSNGNAISGVTITAPGATFASTTASNGKAVSNDMGAIGTNKTYTVTATKLGWVTGTGTVTLSQNTQGTLPLQLAVATTTIKATVTDQYGNPISGATVAATGVTFGSTTDSNGQATSNDMGAIGTNKTYTVTATKTGWWQNGVTYTATLSQYTQGTVVKQGTATAGLKLRATLEITFSPTTGPYPQKVYIYSARTVGLDAIASADLTSSAIPASFALPPTGTNQYYYVSNHGPKWATLYQGLQTPVAANATQPRALTSSY